MTASRKTSVSARSRVPSDVLGAVFTPEVRARWRGTPDPTGELGGRLAVLGACGPDPTDILRALHVRWLRAKKAAWESYLAASYACGMFEGERRADLQARLTGADPDGFRSAMAECMTCWFLAAKMRLAVQAQAEGRGRKVLDMRVALPEGEAGVEVKAPLRPRPSDKPSWSGDDADKIRQCLAGANTQFDKDRPNVLVIVPALRMSMCCHRRDLVKAAYGESVIKVPINTRTGQGGEPFTEFAPYGKFLNVRRPGGKPLKKDGLPACRRISAMMAIEEFVHEKHRCPDAVWLLASKAEQDRSELCRIADRMRDLYCSHENEVWIDHRVVVLHNPYAYHRIGEDTWREFPQLVQRGDGMVWTDGYNAFV